MVGLECGSIRRITAGVPQSTRTIKATPFVTASLEVLRESLLHFEGGSMKGGPPLGQGTGTRLLLSPSTLTGTPVWRKGSPTGGGHDFGPERCHFIN